MCTIPPFCRAVATGGLLVLLILVPLSQTFSAGERTYGDFKGVVLHSCYDGDTCTFTIPGVHPLLGDHIGVRIRGMDAPEIRGKCEAEREGALRARDELVAILTRAKEIRLVDVARDKYFRILATVTADGRDVSAALVKIGLARHYEGGTRLGWCETSP